MTDFEQVFGARPFGPRDFAMKQKQQAYDFEKTRFEGPVEHDWPAEALVLFDEYGMGMPVAWKRTTAEQVFVAFPEAIYARPLYTKLSTASQFPDSARESWLLKSVAEGWYVPNLSELLPGLPDRVTNRNEANKPTE